MELRPLLLSSPPRLKLQSPDGTHFFSPTPGGPSFIGARRAWVTSYSIPSTLTLRLSGAVARSLNASDNGPQRDGIALVIAHKRPWHLAVHAVAYFLNSAPVPVLSPD